MIVFDVFRIDHFHQQTHLELVVLMAIKEEYQKKRKDFIKKIHTGESCSTLVGLI